jgi:hypothetical protein
VEVRSQKSKGAGRNKFGGPDTYIAVQVVPEGVTRLAVLNEKIARKRGIVIRFFGEVYYQHQGPRSRYAHTLARAQAYADEINKGGSDEKTRA